MSLLNLVLTRSKFTAVRNRFYRQAEANPLTAELIIYSTSHADSYNSFLGDSDRTFETKTVRCLYDLEALGNKRATFGVEQDTEAVLFISPISLFKAFGFYKFPNINQVIVSFRGKRYIISYDRYLEEMYGQCIAIQLELKTEVRGG